jgi:hypothetical protein
MVEWHTLRGSSPQPPVNKCKRGGFMINVREEDLWTTQ